MDAKEYAKSTDGERHLVDWQFGFGGDFNNALFQAISLADTGNKYRLGIGFPDEVEAFRRYSQENGYWESLRKRLKI